MNKYKKLAIITVGLILIIGGFKLSLNPECVSKWVIFAIGIIWILKGVNMILEIRTKELEAKIKELEKLKENE